MKSKIGRGVFGFMAVIVILGACKGRERTELSSVQGISESRPSTPAASATGMASELLSEDSPIRLAQTFSFLEDDGLFCEMSDQDCLVFIRRIVQNKSLSRVVTKALVYHRVGLHLVWRNRECNSFEITSGQITICNPQNLTDDQIINFLLGNQ